MAKILHVLTKKNDSLAGEVISRHRRDSERQTETVDLTQEQADYATLLGKIFEADSIVVW